MSLLNDTVYIMGRGYSGSTILSSLLGHIEHIQCVGELIYPMTILCGCGQPFTECVFWQKVIQIFEEDTNLEWESSIETIRSQAHIKNYLRTLFARKNGPYLRELAEIDRGIRVAVLKAAGATVMLDSSKQPTRALMLIRTSSEARFLHIVRSPDRYLYSYIKRSERGHFTFMRRNLGRQSANFLLYTLVALSWLVANLQSEVLRIFDSKRILRVRYEDLIEQPEREMKRIGSFLDINVDPLIEAMDQGERIPVGHIIAGNAHMREAGGFIFEPHIGRPVRLPLKYDIMVKMISWPLMLLYGYPILHHTPPSVPSKNTAMFDA